MKGTLFQRPLEFNLIVDGESWHQGEEIAGRLIVKNHGNTEASTEGVQVMLARAEIRKVQAKSPEAFKPLGSFPMPATGPIPSQKDASFEWKFQLDRNAPITDKGSSLFFVYGQGEATEKMGQLQVFVHPVALIQEFLSLVTIHFRFVVKTQKTSKGFVEVKLDPPDSKSFGTLESLVLQFRFEGDTLQVRYVFNTKKTNVLAGNVSVSKEKKEVEQSFEPHQYLHSSGRLKHETVDAAIRDALAQVNLSPL